MHHPQAIISSKAEIGSSVSIAPFAIIEAGAVIGDNTEIRSSAVITGFARVGDDCVIHSGAVIGGDPQDLKFKGEDSLAIIGNRTVIREYVTINRGTEASGKTEVGDDCLIMAYCHAAHDCFIGNHVVLANATQLGGHVLIDDHAVVGGVVKIHQFCRVGKHAMLGADTKIVKDVAPYLLVDGNPAQVFGLNKIGLKRRGFTADVLNELEEFYTKIYHSGLNITEGLNKFLQERGDIFPETQNCVDFIRSSKRGIMR